MDEVELDETYSDGEGGEFDGGHGERLSMVSTTKWVGWAEHTRHWHDCLPRPGLCLSYDAIT